jgi:hypothetical protein
MATHRTIHHVAVDDATVATLLEAADTAKLSLLDFEAWVLHDWARLYEQHKAARQRLMEAFSVELSPLVSFEAINYVDAMAELQDAIGVIPGGD